MRTMTALVLQQPYASMVAGLIPGWEKPIESRTWRPTVVRGRRSETFRGELLIVAGKGWFAPPSYYDGPARGSALLPEGVALCTVRVVNDRPMRSDDWTWARCDPYPGKPPYAQPIAWVLESPRLVERFPVHGMQKLFNAKLPAGGLKYLREPKPLRTDLVPPAVGRLLPCFEDVGSLFAAHA